jgi:hypothetical protein
VHCVRKNGGVDREEVSEVASPAPKKPLKIAYKEQMEKNRKERDEGKYGEYRKCDFIHDSSPEIERVWSAAEKVLSPARFSTHPTLLEGFLFLQFII